MKTTFETSLSKTSTSSQQTRPYKIEELVRIISQSLYDNGFGNSARLLEQESGFQLETSIISQIRTFILDGKWDKAQECIRQLQLEYDHIAPRLTFLILRQHYLECLIQRRLKDALLVLRTELAAVSNAEELHELSTWIMCPTLEALYEKAGPVPSIDQKRHELYAALMSYVPERLVIPPRRLETLLKQAIEFQQSNCLYWNDDKTDVSLYTDYTCDRSNFPTQTVHILEDHTDEVWYVAFSPSGTYLASASKDFSCIIWNVSDWSRHTTLSGHDDAVSFVAWSQDDRQLLSCSNDNKLKLWDIQDGTCIRTYARHSDAVTSCAWLPQGDRFVSSSLDKIIYLWNVDGSLLYRWLGARVTDLAINQSGSKMIAVCHEKKIRIYDLVEKTEEYIQEESAITSLSLAADSKLALINIAAQEIHLWNLETKTLVHKFVGQIQGRFVIRSCFGGFNQKFVVSGSEDANVYIWHRDQAKLLEVLPGHSGTVNSVTWNPKLSSMFASASDDGTIRIWGKKSAQ